MLFYSTQTTASGPRAPARQMVVRLILCPCLESREDPENQPNNSVSKHHEVLFPHLLVLSLLSGQGEGVGVGTATTSEALCVH